MSRAAEAGTSRHVGPVLASGFIGDAVARAIRDLNPAARIGDRGGYLRVMVPERCRVTRAAIEANLGGPFRLPGDLERVMPSFRGRFSVTEDEAAWELEEAGA